MSGPTQVRLKRKRNEPAPDTLIVEQPHKRAHTGDVTTDDVSEEDVSTHLQYVRQEKAPLLDAQQSFSENSVKKRQHGLEKNAKGTARPTSKGGRRTFHLTRAREPDGITKTRRAKGARVQEELIATFEEKRGGRASAALHDAVEQSRPFVAAPQADGGKSLRRPGRGSALGGKRDASAQTRTPETGGDRERMEAIAHDMHQFALDEVAKPKMTAMPRFTTRRRDIERARGAIPEPHIRDNDMDVDDDADYVYETYVLAANSNAGPLGPQAPSTLGDIGYLIITDEDQSIWETYIEDEGSDKDFDTDDEDENAEDYYGADYPEDELASDDEYGRNAYGYRRNGASDDEEWDEDTGAYSDEDEYERTMNPWKTKTPSQSAKQLGGGEHDN